MRQTVDNMAASYPRQQNPVCDDAFHAKMAVNRVSYAKCINCKHIRYMFLQDSNYTTLIRVSTRLLVE